MNWKHLGTVNVHGHEVRFVFDSHAKAGMYNPAIQAFLKGPNGSVAGYGPKGFPQWLWRIFPGYWPGSLSIKIPHLRWRFFRKHARIGRVYSFLYRLNYKLLARVAAS